MEVFSYTSLSKLESMIQVIERNDVIDEVESFSPIWVLYIFNQKDVFSVKML